MVDNNFASRLESLLHLYKQVACKTAMDAFSASEWGLKDKFETNIEKLEDFQILFLYMLMVEWKTYEHNTFFLELNENSCPNITYPSLQVDKCCNSDVDLMEKFIKLFHCKYHMDIRPMLKVWGIYPVGQVPDGISFMYINEGTDCDNNIFQVNKQ